MKNKFITKILIAVLAFPLLVIYFSCQSPAGPEDLTPGRRDYSWTVDTLNYPFNTIYRIWGSSPIDVWSISSGGFLDKTIFHFDGNNWTTDGISRSISPSAIFGFSSSNVYIGGSNGRIWHFDGSNWKQIAELSKDENNQVGFDNMWGESPNDIYAFGAYPDSNSLFNNSVIAHFTNNNWSILNTDGLKGIVENLYKNKTDQKIYLRVISIGGIVSIDSSNIFEYLQGKFNKIYSSSVDNANTSLINNEVYFVLGREIARRIDNKFQTIFNVDVPNFYNNIWGRNSNDIFLSMTDGLAHYNGNTIEYLLHFDKPRTQIFGAMLFDKDVFFLVYESQTNLNLIHHGRLK
ncbi:MAG: hypothetical protein COW08_01100 [Ignavibacteriales bacterium CG12_big_fil_rev_8_21_14_0_65_30_8]|nr:MAG: hypothetical protein COW08_01100 [Ignavibacteriales bacterium CG12_big_fil_rev_8_21_14_0_65_30_8]